MNSRITIALFVLAASPGFSEPVSRAQARALVEEALAGHHQMYEQVRGVHAVLAIETSRESASREPYATLPQHVAEVLPGPGPDGLVRRNSTLTWTSDVMWDRPSACSVVSTTRTRHFAGGKEWITTPRTVHYCSFDGHATATYRKLRASGANPQVAGEVPLDDDMDMVTDFTHVAAIRNRRYDEHLKWTLDVNLGEVPEDGARASIVDEGTTVTLAIDYYRENETAPHARETFAFARLPFGLALAGFESRILATGRIARTEIEYSTVDGGGSPVHLPVRRTTTLDSPGPDGQYERSRTTVRVQSLELSPDGFTRDQLKNEHALRYGVSAANVMDEMLGDLPAGERVQASP